MIGNIEMSTKDHKLIWVFIVQLNQVSIRYVINDKSDFRNACLPSALYKALYKPCHASLPRNILSLYRLGTQQSYSSILAGITCLHTSINPLSK